MASGVTVGGGGLLFGRDGKILEHVFFSKPKESHCMYIFHFSFTLLNVRWTNLVPTVLRLLGQRVITGRISGVMEKIRDF